MNLQTNRSCSTSWWALLFEIPILYNAIRVQRSVDCAAWVWVRESVHIYGNTRAEHRVTVVYRHTLSDNYLFHFGQPTRKRLRIIKFFFWSRSGISLTNHRSLFWKIRMYGCHLIPDTVKTEGGMRLTQRYGFGGCGNKSASLLILCRNFDMFTA
jgi:hypothetical protein